MKRAEAKVCSARDFRRTTPGGQTLQYPHDDPVAGAVDTELPHSVKA